MNTRPARRKADGSVQIGSTVTIDFGDGPEQLMVSGAGDLAAGVDVVTPSSPLGRAILGARPSDVVTYTSPAGRTVAVTVLTTD